MSSLGLRIPLDIPSANPLSKEVKAATATLDCQWILFMKAQAANHLGQLHRFMILPKEKTTIWVKQNGNFFQQNYSVIKIEQN